MKEAIEAYVKAIEEAHRNDPFWGHRADQRHFSVEYGKKFAKVVKTDGQRSVHCFVNIENGDIYKAATWSAPVKDKRGNIADANPPVFGKDFYKNKS